MSFFAATKKYINAEMNQYIFAVGKPFLTPRCADFDWDTLKKFLNKI